MSSSLKKTLQCSSGAVLSFQDTAYLQHCMHGLRPCDMLNCGSHACRCQECCSHPSTPHSLSSRPLVLPESIQIRVKVPADSRSEMWCSFDGKDRQRLAPGDAVLIYMSQHPIPTVCKLDASHDWFLSMHNGLHWNIRKQQAGAGK